MICPCCLRIGLSATQRPLDEIARFLGGHGDDGPRPVTIVDAGSRKPLELEVVVPVEDMAELAANPAPLPNGPIDLTTEPRASIWPHVHPRLVELIREHDTTLIFCNARRLAERLAAQLNDCAGEELVRAHHGSLSREQRLVVESDLKAGRLKAIVVPRHAEEPSAAELRAFLRQRLAPHKIPRSFETRAALPRSATGKRR